MSNIKVGTMSPSDRSKRRAYYYFVLPAFIIYIVVIIFPVGMSFVLGFTDWKGYGPIEFIGLQNYIEMFKDDVFLFGLRNNIIIMLSSIFIQIPLGLLIAYMLHRRMVKARKFFEFMIFIPITISAIVVALLWLRIFSPVGVVPSVIQKVTGNPNYVMTIFDSKNFAIVPVLFVLLWQNVSLYMVIFLANLQRIPDSLIEASFIDGASEMTIFTKVITPQLTDVIFINSLFAISGSFKSFDLIWAMTAGGPSHFTDVIGIYMYNNTFVYQNYGFGAAVSIVIILFSVSIIVIAKFISKRYQKV